MPGQVDGAPVSSGEQRLSRGPASESARGIDVPRCADVHEPTPPRVCERLRTCRAVQRHFSAIGERALRSCFMYKTAH